MDAPCKLWRYSQIPIFITQQVGVEARNRLTACSGWSRPSSQGQLALASQAGRLVLNLDEPVWRSTSCSSSLASLSPAQRSQDLPGGPGRRPQVAPGEHGKRLLAEQGCGFPTSFRRARRWAVSRRRPCRSGPPARPCRAGAPSPDLRRKAPFRASWRTSARG
jgi:hypothetical protein